MGGLTFYLGVLCGVVAGYAALVLGAPKVLGDFASQQSVALFIAVLTSFAFGLVGFVDDYIKVVKKRNLGLRARAKIVAQILITGAFLMSLHLNLSLIHIFPDRPLFAGVWRLSHPGAKRSSRVAGYAEKNRIDGNRDTSSDAAEKHYCALWRCVSSGNGKTCRL